MCKTPARLISQIFAVTLCAIMILSAQQDGKRLTEEKQQGVWLPEGEIILQPFLHLHSKRQKTSLVSRSSNATSGQSLQPGASVGADGSNNEASKDSNESEREPQSVGVKLSALASMHDRDAQIYPSVQFCQSCYWETLVRECVLRRYAEGNHV